MARTTDDTTDDAPTRDPEEGPLDVYVQHIADRLEGRSGGLRTSKPTAQADTGLEQYCWRIAMFVSNRGSDSIPVMANSWLQGYVDEHTDLDASVSGILDEQGKEITSQLFAVVDAALDELGVATGAAARRWGRVL